jgi:hypothetical protein
MHVFEMVVVIVVVCSVVGLIKHWLDARGRDARHGGASAREEEEGKQILEL